jgi:hypothetical protein
MDKSCSTCCDFSAEIYKWETMLVSTTIIRETQGRSSFFAFNTLYFQTTTFNMQGMKRQYEQLIREYLGYFPCVVLIGARDTHSVIVDWYCWQLT